MGGRWLVLAAACGGVAMMASPARADQKCSVGELLQLPVTMVDRQPTVPVEINGHKTRLVADSGAFFSMIPSSVAAEYQLPRRATPDGFYLVGVGGRANVDIAVVKDFTLAGHTFHQVEFLAGGSEPGESGLLGQNVLGIADVEYDLPDGVVRLMRPHDCGNVNLAYWAKNGNFSVIDIKPAVEAGMHTQGTVEIDGVKLSAIFDTGAATTILTRHAANRLGFKPDAAGVKPAGVTWGLGRSLVRTWIAPFADLKLGDNEQIKNIHLRVGDIDDDSYDMLIVADFFLSHRVYVSNALHKMFFSYVGGPVFDLSVHNDTAPVSTVTPTTAEAFSGRGTAFAARHQFAAAKDDLTHAIALAPGDPRYRLERARVELESGDKATGSADLDAALKLAPNDIPALMVRAELRTSEGDKAGARADADAVNAAAAPQSNDRLDLAMLYDRLGDTPKALTQYGLWIDAHRDDSRLPLALNNRCWLRTLAGTDLKAAIDDCDRAVHLASHNASYLDSRGLAHLRNGDTKKAIDDYDDALKIDPKIASSLYGRGLAKRRIGDAAGGDKDIAAAEAIDPKVADLFHDHGITR